MSPSLKLAWTLHQQDRHPQTGPVLHLFHKNQTSRCNWWIRATVSICLLSSDLLPQFHTMDTATAVTLLALVMAMAGVSQALHIQGSLDKDDILLGSEENMSDHLLGLVRHK